MWRVEDLSLIFLVKLARLEQKTSGLNRAVSEGTRNGGAFGSSLLHAANKQVAGACPNGLVFVFLSQEMLVCHALAIGQAVTWESK